MIKKLAKKIFSKEVDQNNVIALIEEFITENKLDNKSVYNNLSSELMKLKQTSVYLNSDFIKRDIKPELSGDLIYFNPSAVHSDVLFIIGPSSTNLSNLLTQVNEIDDSAKSDDELLKRLKQLKKICLDNDVEVKFMYEYKNPQSISRLHFDCKQGTTVNAGQIIGYFEDFEFNSTAKDYIKKYSIVDQYCSSVLLNKTKTKDSERPSKVEENKKKKLRDIWDGDIKIYDQMIVELQKEMLLPDYEPETVISFIQANSKGDLYWVKKPTKGYQSYMAGLLYVLSEKEFILINSYSSIVLKEICKNTFFKKDDSLNVDAFNKMRAGVLDKKYITPFRQIIKRMK